MGEGVDKDSKEAVKWFRLAAEKNYAMAIQKIKELKESGGASIHAPSLGLQVGPTSQNINVPPKTVMVFPVQTFSRAPGANFVLQPQAGLPMTNGIQRPAQNLFPHPQVPLQVPLETPLQGLPPAQPLNVLLHPQPSPMQSNMIQGQANPDLYQQLQALQAQQQQDRQQIQMLMNENINLKNLNAQQQQQIQQLMAILNQNGLLPSQPK
jgi:TPR repeat protein